jgi:hypothetical protein
MTTTVLGMSNFIAGVGGMMMLTVGSGDIVVDDEAGSSTDRQGRWSQFWRDVYATSFLLDFKAGRFPYDGVFIVIHAMGSVPWPT